MTTVQLVLKTEEWDHFSRVFVNKRPENANRSRYKLKKQNNYGGRLKQMVSLTRLFLIQVSLNVTYNSMSYILPFTHMVREYVLSTTIA